MNLRALRFPRTCLQISTGDHMVMSRPSRTKEVVAHAGLFRRLLQSNLLGWSTATVKLSCQSRSLLTALVLLATRAAVVAGTSGHTTGSVPTTQWVSITTHTVPINSIADTIKARASRLFKATVKPRAQLKTWTGSTTSPSMSQLPPVTQYSNTTVVESSRSTTVALVTLTTLSLLLVGAKKTALSTTLSAILGVPAGANMATSESLPAAATVSAVSTRTSSTRLSQRPLLRLSDRILLWYVSKSLTYFIK